MTDPQSIFFTDLANAIRDETWTKSTTGIDEHGGGNIWDIPMLDLIAEAKNEFIDGYVYVYTLETILKKLLQDPEIAKRVKELL